MVKNINVIDVKIDLPWDTIEGLTGIFLEQTTPGFTDFIVPILIILLANMVHENKSEVRDVCVNEKNSRTNQQPTEKCKGKRNKCKNLSLDFTIIFY